MKIVYCINSISHTGGIERVTIAKANALADIPGNEVWIAYTDVNPSHPEPVLPVDARVRLSDLNIRYYADDYKGWYYRMKSNLRRRKHKKILKELLDDIRPDIVVSTGQCEKYFLPGLCSKHTPAYVREFHYHRYYRKEGAKSLAGRIKAAVTDFYDFRLQLPRYDATCVLTQEDFDRNWRHSRIAGKVHVIPNPLTEHTSARAHYDAHTAVTVGRIAAQKNHASLVRAWERVAETHPDWKLAIYGDGELMEALRTQVAEAGLEESVLLKGRVDEVSERMAECSIFVLTSRFEGFGLVLTEAANVGLPMVSYACPCGPRDIISDGTDGMLVPPEDEESLARALKKLMGSEPLRRRMGEAALQTARRYDPATIARQWMELFNKLTNR